MLRRHHQYAGHHQQYRFLPHRDPHQRADRPYLQQAGLGGLTVDEAGTDTIIQNEVALFFQDSWKPRSNLTLNYGLRWERRSSLI